MGYRHYFYSVPKKEIEEIKQCKTKEKLLEWAKTKGYKTDDCEDDLYFPSYRIGKEIYEFGKHVDWAFKMQEKNESIYGNGELKEFYNDERPVICSQDDFLTAIKIYKENIINYYKGLLEEEDKYSKLTIEQRCRNHIENQLSEWENDFRLCPINTDLKVERINDSWLYEYAIFELVRVYKAFDWKNDTLVLLGW